MARTRIGDDYNDSEEMEFIPDDSIEEGAYLLDNEAREMASTQEDAPEARSVSSRCRIREQLERDIQAYLQHGGVIHEVAQGSPPPASSRYTDDYWNPLL